MSSIMNLNLNIVIIIKAGVWKWLPVNEIRGKWSSGKTLDENDNRHQSLFICRAAKLIEILSECNIQVQKAAVL